MATVLAAVAFATLLSAFAAAWRETGRRFDSNREALHGIASALAFSVAGATDKGDRRSVAAGLNAIGSIPKINYAIVVDAEGRRLYETGSGIVLGSAQGKLSVNADIGPFTSAYLGTYLVSVPIVSGGRNVGQLSLIADVSELRSALLQGIAEALIAGALAAALGLLITTRLLIAVTGPIAALTRSADRVRRTGDYSTPLPQTSTDETGQLVGAFNAMLVEIRARDKALSDHRDRLAFEVEERTVELVAAKDVAERANAAKSDFLATMSHEIRTPLNGILAMAELLTVGSLDAKSKRHSEIILKSGRQLLVLINDVLDLAKIEAGHLEIESIACSPTGLVEDVVQLFTERAHNAGLALDFEFDPQLPSNVLGDPLRLTQVLSNLVSNAIKFTAQGGVRLRVAQISAPDVGLRLRFSVTDTGIGIPQDKLATLFDAFTQAEASTSRRFGGTGIGLTISRRLVTAMGGEITVESQPGRGTTFAFEIPAVAAVSHLPHAARLSQSSAGIAPLVSFDGARVLAVDDSPINREVLEETLSRLGVNVTSVDTGAEAIAAVQRERFDLVFMDGSMPEMDGFEATRRIRAWETLNGGAPTTIVALTAYVVGPQAEAWREAGMNAYIAKPFGLADIEACLSRWLEPRRSVDRNSTAVVSVTDAISGSSPKAAKEVPAVEDLPPLLDRSQLQSMASMRSSRTNLAQRVVKLFVEHTPRQMEHIETCAIEGGKLLEAAAHALKSSCRNIGAIRVGDLCDAIELAAALDKPVTSQELQQVRDALYQTLALLESEYPVTADLKIA